MQKDFDHWNTKKKLINIKHKDKVIKYEEGRIYWCNIGLNVGVEIDGKDIEFIRPVLVIRKFTKQDFWGIPLTTKTEEKFNSINTHLKSFYFRLGKKDDKQISLLALRQMKLLDSKRILKKVTRNEFKNKLDSNTLKEIKESIKDIL